MKDIKKLINKSKAYDKIVDLTFLKNDNILRKILYFVDVLLLSLVFLFFGLGGSGFINSFICKPLDKQKNDFVLFGETTYESLAIILLVFILLFYVPRKVPSIVPFPDWNHIKFRELSKHVIIAFSIIFGHERLLNKYHYLLGVDDK